MEAQEQLPLGRLVKNSASLLEMLRGDASALQQHLADLIESLPPRFAGQLDMIAFQSVDQLTQMLQDLATAFHAVSRGIDEGRLDEVGSIIDELKLEKVRDTLRYGNDASDRPNHVELF